jgi:nucleoside phosphorylase
MDKPSSKAQLSEARFGIITALTEEYVAVCEVLGCEAELAVPGRGAGRKYSIAKLTTAKAESRTVAVALLSDMGNNSAAIRATQMSNHCPNVEYFLMVGIAGAVPKPMKTEDHVRLGDIVLIDRHGVVQYDLDKEEPAVTVHRHPPRPPGAALLEAVRSVTVGELRGDRPWEAYMKEATLALGSEWKRPSARKDVLEDQIGTVIRHPKDSERRKGHPRVFHGPIASANKLLKNPTKRDALRDHFGIKAVEMEGSGIADAAWNLDKEYLVVRGTCDYCNPSKGDDWHNYAALAAAAYARCIVENTSPSTADISVEPKSNKARSRRPLTTSANVKVAELKRRQDVEQLKRLFYWIHLGVMDEFFHRLTYTRLTLEGEEFYGNLHALVNSVTFHIHDAKLLKLIHNFVRAWSRCFTYSDYMEVERSGRWSYFELQLDIFVSSEQERQYYYTGKQLRPTRAAFDALLGYVHSNFHEVNPSKTGRQAHEAYRKQAKMWSF